MTDNTGWHNEFDYGSSQSGGGGGEEPPGVVGDAESPWPVINAKAFHGPAGDIVKHLAPNTEADPVAILVQTLAAVGNAIGRTAYYQVEGDRHHTNLFAVLVGRTGKGRKGTSMGRVRQVMDVADPHWLVDKVKSGLSSGEGLIWHVRDEIRGFERDSRKGLRVETTIDPGVTDKRLLVEEQEFASALAAMKRQGNTLSAVVRSAWDRGSLQALTKNSPARATGAHISIIGHITDAELRSELDRVSVANGFANRFLFVCVRRSKFLPFGGEVDDHAIYSLSAPIKNAIASAQGLQRVIMTAEARGDWEEIYPVLSEGEPGLLGAIIGRAEAQVCRLGLLYALLDGSAHIDVPHLHAAVALWDYCDEFARYIFGDEVGDPVADTILAELRRAGETGLTRAAIRDLLGRNYSAKRIERALLILRQNGRAGYRQRVGASGGRPAEVWFATRRGPK